MSSASQVTSRGNQAVSAKALWCGRGLSGLAILFLLMDAAMKIFKAAPSVKATVNLGYSTESVPTIGVLLLFSVAVYALPRTAILGAILLTGYLGGAIAANVRVNTPLFSQVLFPGYIAVIAWLGLYLRDIRLRVILPLRATSE